MDETDPRSIHTRLEEERAASQPEADLLVLFRKYAIGKQRNVLSTKERKAVQGLAPGGRGRERSDNICGTILRTHGARCQIARWDVAPTLADNAASATAAAAVHAWVTALWTFSAGPWLQNNVTHATLRDGNHAVALAWDAAANRPRLIQEPWWNGSWGVWVAYSDLDQPLYAVKEWTDARGRKRRIIWWPDRIQRYIAADGWQPYADPTQGGRWEDRWEDRQGAPLGLPVVHFRNASPPPDSEETDNHYALSLLYGGVVGLQDDMNSIQWDVTATAKFTAFQMYVFHGVGVDEDGNPPQYDVQPGAAITIPGPGGGEVLPPGSIDPLEKALFLKIGAVSRNTATPIHVITGGDWPSGDALQQADAPLAEATDALQASLSPAWGSLLHKATVLHNTFNGDPELDTAALIRPVYRPARPQAPQALATEVATLAPVLSEQEALRRLGYEPTQVDKIIDERDKTAKRDQALVFAGGPISGT